MTVAARRFVVASWVLVALGMAARLEQFWFCRSLRFDEGSLAINLVGRSFARLLEPLDAMQAAPIGFLWVERLAVLCFGDGERALRLFPMLCGLMGLLLFRRLALKLLAPGAALLAIALVAFNEDLVALSNDVKQYSTDAFATIAILLAAVEWRDAAERGEARARGWIALLLVGTLAVFFSHPSCFVLAAVGAVGFVAALRRRDRPELLRWTVAAAVWLLAFVGSYSVSLRVADEGGLRDFWNAAFLPFPPRAPSDWEWYWYYPLRLFRDPGNMQPAGLIAAIFVAGCVSLSRRARDVAIAAVALVLLPLLASALHLYPFKGRFLLFVVPVAAIGVAEGCAAVGALVALARRPALARTASALAAAVVLGPELWIVAPKLAGREIRDLDMAGAMEDVSRHARAGDLLCSAFYGVPVQSYYERRLALDRRGLELRGLPPADSFTALAGRRAWLLLQPSDAPSDPLASHILERRPFVGVDLCLAQF